LIPRKSSTHVKMKGCCYPLVSGCNHVYLTRTAAPEHDSFSQSVSPSQGIHCNLRLLQKLILHVVSLLFFDVLFHKTASC
jgi:hypothetical protein